MTNILMLLSNAFRPDPRVAREASALAREGYRVKIIAWDRQREFTPTETCDGYEIMRIQSIRTSYGAGVKQILFLPRFWLAALRNTRSFKPDIIHCHDLDTLFAGVWLKLRSGAALIYDAHEDYPALMSLYLPGLFVRFLRAYERLLLRFVDHTITASTVLADRYAISKVSSVSTLGNVPDLGDFDRLDPSQIQEYRANLGVNDSELLVAYIGGFSRNRMIIPLIEAGTGLDGVQVCIWGDGHQREQVEHAANTAENVRYLGWLPTERLPITMRAVDVIVYLLKVDYPGAIYNAPNTLSNAMAAGCPIICNPVGDLGRIVEKHGCGILLKEIDATAIRNAIAALKDPSLRRSLGEAGRKAAEEKYNWTTVSRSLLDLYRQLLDTRRS